uniref:Uncharacterized protein n=1 Tax=Oryza rufipogon TaxID=4529 RepID=A0A0E0N8L9_ORYRU
MLPMLPPPALRAPSAWEQATTSSSIGRSAMEESCSSNWPATPCAAATTAVKSSSNRIKNELERKPETELSY